MKPGKQPQPYHNAFMQHGQKLCACGNSECDVPIECCKAESCPGRSDAHVCCICGGDCDDNA